MGGRIYFEIADMALGKQILLHFLENITQIWQMNKGLREIMSNFHSCLQEQLTADSSHFAPDFHNSESTDCLIKMSSPSGQSEAVASTKAPELGKASMLEKTTKEHTNAMREIQ